MVTSHALNQSAIKATTQGKHRSVLMNSSRMSSSYRVERGNLESTQARYELYLPSNASSENKVGAVILLHGFQCKLDYHRGTAAMLARNNVACLILDMLSLMGLVKKTLHQLREKNVLATLGYVEWLSARPEIQPGKLVLAGYSAGGAVALETASAIAGKGGVRGVLLLDAVPWVSTLDKGAAANSLIAPNPSTIDGTHSKDVCIVASLRGEPSSYNAYGLIMEQLARGIGASKSSCDVRIVSARHGDFMCSSETDLSVGVHGLMGSCMQCIGLFSNSRVRSDIQDLTLAFVLSVLGENPSAYSTKISEIEGSKRLVVGQIDASLRSMRDNLPRFLQ